MNPSQEQLDNLAATAAQRDEVPVGAVVVHKTLGAVGCGFNRREERHSAIAHAEILAIDSGRDLLARL